MSKSINLAHGPKKSDSIFKRALLISVLFFCLVVALTLGLISYRLILKNNFDKLEADEKILNSQILANIEKRDKYIETKTRLADIKKILATRAATDIKVDTLSTIVPPDTTINTLSGDNQQIKLTVESENLSSLDDLIQNKLIEASLDAKKGIVKVDMDSFGLNPGNKLYNATLTVIFN